MHGCVTVAVMMEIGIYRGLVVIMEHLLCPFKYSEVIYF